MSDNPDMTYTQAYSLAKSGAGQGRYFEGGEIKPFKGAPESAGEMKKGEKLGAQQAEIETVAEVERQKELGKEKAKFEISFPKVRNTLTSLNQQWDLVDKTIDEAINAVNPFTAGVGSWLASVPGSPQKNLSAKLDTIRANIGFDKLQDMRANSPTGAALGPVSDLENKLLQSVKGSTDQAQSASQLKQNLMNIKADLQALKAEKNTAFKTDYGQFLKDTEITTKTKRDISKATTWLKSSKDESEAKKKIKQLYSIGRYGDTRNPWTEDELLQIIRDAGYGK